MTKEVPDWYSLFDKVGLTAGTLLTSKTNMNATVNTIRVKLAAELTAQYEDHQAVKERVDG